MALALGFDNAIGWGQLQLRRGWKNVLATTIAYLVVVGGLILGSLRLDYLPGLGVRQILSFWTMALMGLQMAVLLLFGCSAVSSAIRKDISSGMIESHRLMNVSGIEAVAGYIFGSTCQILPVAAANVLLGSFTTAYSFSVSDWLLANMVLFVFALSAWCAMALLAFVAQAGSKFLVGVIVVLVIGKGILPSVLPGLTALISPMIRGTVFGIALGMPWHRVYEISIGGHCAVGALCFIGAVRKYRRDDVLAFGPLLGLVLVAAWIAMSIAGISDWQAFTPNLSGILYTEDVGYEAQIIVALLVSLILATVPISAAAWLQTQWHRRQRLNDPALLPRPIPTPLTALAAAAIPLGLPWLIDQPVHPTADQSLRTFLIMALFLLGTSYLMRILYLAGPSRTRLLVALWFSAVWLAPLGIDFARAGIHGFEEGEPVLGPISSCSPIGAFIHLWTDSGVDTGGGLVVNGILVALLAGLFHKLRPRGRTG